MLIALIYVLAWPDQTQPFAVVADIAAARVSLGLRSAGDDKHRLHWSCSIHLDSLDLMEGFAELVHRLQACSSFVVVRRHAFVAEDIVADRPSWRPLSHAVLVLTSVWSSDRTGIAGSEIEIEIGSTDYSPS